MILLLNYLKKITYKQMIGYTILFLLFASSLFFVHHNHSFYDRTIAQVFETSLVETTELIDLYSNEDQLFIQEITAEVKNGEHKGERLKLTNQYSSSGAYDQQYQIGNELFVWIDPNTLDSDILNGTIEDVKRDKYLLLITWIFIFTLLLVGKKQGLYSIISLIIIALLLSLALDLYVRTSNISLVLICGIAVILFTIISLLLVNGFNEKSYAAIVATLLGTFSILLITYIVISFTSGRGLRYEEMQFLTRPHEMVFMAGVLVGSLGAVMDVAITMSSSLFGLYEKNNTISNKALKKSGMEIGKDIMGTMTNILFFAYISGSIPMLILYLNNASPLGYTFSINLSLELARALAGGIGIVLAIPIGLYITIFFINRKRAKR
ncbi:YibE/F-like protein [Halalkalibacter krulwichiae]|uniref:YibE/F-like protein n=2 Tax=Halalkalibacter krulwichiae TaxID=199441 RepID=A0A1X9M9I6_9BACI|nr:YibE/F-like protein [Halalkalibacter krulwichiae]